MSLRRKLQCVPLQLTPGPPFPSYAHNLGTSDSLDTVIICSGFLTETRNTVQYIQVHYSGQIPIRLPRHSLASNVPLLLNGCFNRQVKALDRVVVMRECDYSVPISASITIGQTLYNVACKTDIFLQMFTA